MAPPFLPTLPSLVCNPPVSIKSLATPKCSSNSVTTIRCSKLETGGKISEDSFIRRDFLKCAGASVGMGLMPSSGPFVQKANAADLIQRRQRAEFQTQLREIITIALEKNQELIPSILMLALNDAITYDKATKSGGANGSIRLEIERPENKALAPACSFLEDTKKEIDSVSKGGPISYADLIQFAAQNAVKFTFLEAAVKRSGGNRDKGAQLYAAFGSSGQWLLFDKNFGRSDADAPDPEGRVPQWDKASVEEMKDRFVAVGLGPRQLAVMSAFLGPDIAATEAMLVSDPEVSKWVDSYQRSRQTVSRTNYEVDLISAFTKLSSFGQSINYEAYTYAPPKIDIKKLKL